MFNAQNIILGVALGGMALVIGEALYCGYRFIKTDNELNEIIQRMEVTNQVHKKWLESKQN